jgi:hypothetical protein
VADLRDDLAERIERGKRHEWHPSRIAKLSKKLDALDDMILSQRIATMRNRLIKP